MKGLDLVLEVSFNINIFLLARKEIYNVQYGFILGRSLQPIVGGFRSIVGGFRSIVGGFRSIVYLKGVSCEGNFSNHSDYRGNDL